ncbi:MAG: glycerophosphodiester phosphodiesterase [Deltaproteobacteria bacterium]|nr:MAG: glycerophosphodiester phosphodiesterase [Deltaproteobacteria bacterium]
MGAFPGPLPRVFGHRGAAGVAPENTLASFRRARADGADVFELDVHGTADGEIVVLHDPTLERTTDGAGAVSGLRFAEVAALDAGFHFTPDGGRTHPFRGSGVRVPRLAELVREFPDVPLNIEIKQETPSIVDAVVALLRAARTTVVLAAEQDVIMTAIRRAAPDIATSLAAGEVATFMGALQQGVAPTLPAGAVALQIPPRFWGVELVTRETVAAAHALGAEVHVWTINDTAEMRRLLALGCDGIISDLPADARAVVDAERPRT